MTTFDLLKDIITVKSGTLHEQEDFKSGFSAFMLLRYLSMDPRFCEVAFNLQKYVGVLTNEQLYKLMIKEVPQYKNSYINYISKAKKEKKSED